GVGSFFQRKDLAATMERFFAAEVQKERDRDAAHRDLRLDSFESNPRTTQDMTKKAPPPIPAGASKAPPAHPQAKGTLLGMPAVQVQPRPAPVVEKPAPVAAPSGGAQGLEWDDDDEATAVFDRAKHSFSIPPAAPQAAAPAARPQPAPAEPVPAPAAAAPVAAQRIPQPAPLPAAA